MFTLNGTTVPDAILLRHLCITAHFLDITLERSIRRRVTIMVQYSVLSIMQLHYQQLRPMDCRMEQILHIQPAVALVLPGLLIVMQDRLRIVVSKSVEMLFRVISETMLPLRHHLQQQVILCVPRPSVWDVPIQGHAQVLAASRQDICYS